ncbi:MAG: tripartite tricarboxylate transporter permease [Beijerinckiaceae bacterium]|nr:tripartite tricarboxylate transporter permease [Beijerinckiaceae bacterium]
MDVFSNIWLGLGVASTFQNLVYCMIGTLLGTIVGVLPGIGPVTTLALLLPISFTLDPISALIMMAGIYYGAQYGGSTTAILINIPGEASSVVTSLDGHQMARQGRAGPALGIAALGSFFAGCVAALIIAFGAPPLAKLALQFGPAEYFSLMVCGLVAAVVLAHGSIVKAIGMVILGLLFGLAGSDINSGVRRFTFDIAGLADGVEFVALSMAIYGLAEVAINLEKGELKSAIASSVGRVLPSWADIRTCIPSVLRGTALGSLLGVLPGGGALLASFAAYTLEKKVASHPRNFGNGDIRGVAAPESANNAGAQTSMIPMLTLGIPSNPTMALMIAALMVHGITPGPRVMTDRPELFWGVIASMWIANLMLVVLNLPLVGIWIRLVRVPYRLMFVAIVAFCCVGTYTINTNVTDLAVLAFLTVFGYLCLKLGCEPAPLILGFVLGPMMEENLRRALLISRGDPAIFLSSPLSVGFLVAAALLLVVVAAPAIRSSRDAAMVE